MVAVAAVVAVLLQVLLAPHMAIGHALPNLILVCCLVTSLARPLQSGPVLPFILGLVFDLVSGGPVGAMAFSLVAASSFEAWLFERVNNDTAFMAISVLAFGVMLAELLYGLVFLLFGYAAGVLDAFVYRILPCFLYDFVLSLLAYLVLARLLSGGESPNTEIKQL